MPFSTNVSWLQGLLDIFNVDRDQNGQHYYGPYDRLFNYAVIEGSFTFSLARRTDPDKISAHDTWDFVFVVFMVVLNQELRPVLIVDIQDNGWQMDPITNGEQTPRCISGTMRYYAIARFLACMG
jgi:hypothetical protein